MISKYNLKQIIYVPYEIYGISEILNGDTGRLFYQTRAVDEKGITLTMTEEQIEKYMKEVQNDTDK